MFLLSCLLNHFHCAIVIVVEFVNTNVTSVTSSFISVCIGKITDRIKIVPLILELNNRMEILST